MPTHARKHQLEKSLFYHVYNQSHRGEFIFKKESDFEHFADLLYRLKGKHDIQIYHWVIMSNHYHLCVKLNEPEIISACMAGLQRAYTHYYNRTRAVRGYLWGSRFKSQAIEGEKYLLACGRYIERNPVRAGMVTQAADYRYSSARYYCLGKDDHIADEDLYYGDFGATTPSRQKAYRRYLAQFDHEEETLFRESLQPLGSQAFKACLLKIGEHYFPRRRGRPRKGGIYS